MRIITNPKKVQRYNKIGLYTSLASWYSWWPP
jgi:hypothetical protein